MTFRYTSSVITTTQRRQSPYDPKVLLRIVLYGYYRALVSSRRIAEACRRDVVFMALQADSRPHFTTIAGFGSKLEHEIASLFGEVLQVFSVSRALTTAFARDHQVS